MIITTFGLASLLAMSALNVNAQDTVVSTLNTHSFLERHPVTISTGLGTQGIGLEGKMRIHSNWSVRVGTSYLYLKYSTYTKMDGVVVHDEHQHNWTNIHLLGEFHTPFWKAVDFSIIAGVAYFTFTKATAHLAPTGTYYYGQIQLKDSDIGYVNVASDWKGIAPYAGVALFRKIPHTKFNLSLDLGTYHLPTPKVAMDATGILSNNKNNQSTIEKNMKKYQWLPLVQLSINYNI